MAAKAGARGKVIDYWKFSSFGIVETKESVGIVGQLPKDAGRAPDKVSSFPVVFATCVFVLGPLCAALHLGVTAYRFGGVTLAIVLLVPWAGHAWQIAFNRFAEVSIGIVVALILPWVWLEMKVPSPENTSKHS